MVSWRWSLAFACLVPAIAAAKPSSERSDEIRRVVEEAVTEQRAVVEKTLATVEAKLNEVSLQRAAQARTVTQFLEVDDDTVFGGNSPAAMEQARRVAAIKWLLANQRSEEQLLISERNELLSARVRIRKMEQELAKFSVPRLALQLPVPGDVVRKFGKFEHPSSKAILMRRGVDIEVEDDPPVVASAEGIVRYTGPVRGLDKAVIIAHDGCTTVVAKLGEITVREGQRVEQGAKLGTLSGSRLYFEVRMPIGEAGIPVDPQLLLAR